MKLLAYMFLIALFCTSCHATVAEKEQVKTGAERTPLYIPLLKNKKVGLVANHTSTIGKVHLADTLVRSGVNLVKIFSPEHGFRGESGAGDEIGNSTDNKTGLPVISLYGSRKKPDPADLKGIDIMVYDIQDVGVRFYTYISTLHYVMEACAEQQIPLVIIDRPNPLGYYTDGPVLDTNYRSFVGMHPIPVVYGMTAGELAGMINGEGWLAGNLSCELTVIPCVNYSHDFRYSLPVNPSPNLNAMEAVYLYPSLCFFEGTIMSLGRGTDFPFRVIGHPDFPVKEFHFTPQANAGNKNPLFKGEICYGIDYRSFSTNELQSMDQINLQWLIDVYNNMNMKEMFFTNYIDKLAGTNTLRQQILNGWSQDQIRKSWQDDLNRFREKRKKYLIYKDIEDVTKP